MCKLLIDLSFSQAVLTGETGLIKYPYNLHECAALIVKY